MVDERRIFIVLRLLIASLTGALIVVPAAAQTRLAPFVATPPDVVERMLTLAGVGPNDVVYDLGCGDGRVVITAAQKFGARGVGVDIDPALVQQATDNADAAGVSERVTFRIQDAMTVDVAPATVVTLYLLAAANAKLRPTLMQQLRPGSRIVSHNFPIGDWQPHVVDNFTDAAGKKRTLYLWRIGTDPNPKAQIPNPKPQ
jgi:protein-L-isoaspartate O-methyltransferase